MYADTVVHRLPPFRQPDLGLTGVHQYLNEQLPAEENIECWFAAERTSVVQLTCT